MQISPEPIIDAERPIDLSEIEQTLDTLKPGQRILVSEVHNQITIRKVWHTLRRIEGGRVYTDEVPGGFSSVFVVGVKPSESTGVVIPF